MSKVKPRLIKGMQDSWPELARARREMIARIEAVCQRFGFLPFDTPLMEAREALTGPAPTQDQLEGIFTFVNQDKEEIGLRYDLTVPLARVVSLYPMDIARPFRRYQTGNVFRWDKPGPGRYREFQQFDIDSVGTASLLADAEIIAVIVEILRALDVPATIVRVSNRKILNGLGGFVGASEEQARDIYRVIDKLDKFNRERIRMELGPGLVDDSGDRIAGLGLNSSQIARIDEFLDLPNEGDSAETLAAARRLLSENATAAEGLNEIEELLGLVEAFGVRRSSVVFDLHLARGLGYYTGPVFEVTLTDLPSYGSVFGGGRYDGLVERFQSEAIPAVGASVGVDRLLAALVELKRVRLRRATSQVLVTVLDETRIAEYIAITNELRNAGIAAELWLGKGNLGKQMKYADRLGIPYAVIAGSDEFERGEVSVKDLELGRQMSAETESRDDWATQKQQFTLARADLVAQLGELLKPG